MARDLLLFNKYHIGSEPSDPNISTLSEPFFSPWLGCNICQFPPITLNFLNEFLEYLLALLSSCGVNGVICNSQPNNTEFLIHRQSYITQQNYRQRTKFIRQKSKSCERLNKLEWHLRQSNIGLTKKRRKV